MYVVLPPETIAEENVPPDALEATLGNQLRSEGFDGAAIVMLGGPGGGSTSQLSNFAWSRFCMSDNLGNWVGEILHQTNLCDLPDFFDFAGQYPSGENMGPFDQEAGYLATHLSAWTKRAVGWLDPSTVVLHLGRVAEYTLHSISLIQLPPTGRIAAVQVGDQVPYLMVEARLQADQFDISIPNEGVIIYRVQTTDPLGNAQNDTAPLALLTKTALTAGQSYTAGGVTVRVGSSVPGGFSIQVSTSNPIGRVPDVIEMTASIASKIVTDAGFVPSFSISKGLWVSSQSPIGGTIAPFGTTVTLTMHGGAV
jgi:PASTA domain